ncbi:MAG: YjcZ family sporulation protein [Bacilli bacterium]|nr:YjcZ family sporulation protein [Bacilli bacterium]
MNYQSTPCYYPMNTGCGTGGSNNSTYAIILVLFILLVIVIGTRFVA